MSDPLIIERQNIVGITPEILNVTLTNANTEYSFSIPSHTRRLSLKTRDAQHSVKVAFANGQSGSVYFTLAGESWSEDTILAVDLTLYCQSPNAGCVLEVVIWR